MYSYYTCDFSPESIVHAVTTFKPIKLYNAEF